MPVDFERFEHPLALERAQLLHMPREAWPAVETRLTGDRGLRVGQAKAGAPNLGRAHVARSREMVDERLCGGRFAGTQIGEERLGLLAKVFEIRTHTPPCMPAVRNQGTKRVR